MKESPLFVLGVLLTVAAAFVTLVLLTADPAAKTTRGTRVRPPLCHGLSCPAPSVVKRMCWAIGACECVCVAGPADGGVL